MVVQLHGAAVIFQFIEIVGSVFTGKFYVINNTAVSDYLNQSRVRYQGVGTECGLAGIEALTENVLVSSLG